MQIIEFLGIARTGKTSIAKYLENSNKDIVFHPERHNLAPKDVCGDNFKHNLWYAKYCISELEKALKNDKTHIFERGVVDRVVIGKVYHKMGWLSDKQWEEYSTLLKPYIEKVSRVFVFLIPIEESVRRADKLGKDVKKAIPYMKNLYEEYKKLKEWFPNVEYFSEEASLEELQGIISEAIFS